MVHHAWRHSHLMLEEWSSSPKGEGNPQIEASGSCSLLSYCAALDLSQGQLMCVPTTTGRLKSCWGGGTASQILSHEDLKERMSTLGSGNVRDPNLVQTVWQDIIIQSLKPNVQIDAHIYPDTLVLQKVDSIGKRGAEFEQRVFTEEKGVESL